MRIEIGNDRSARRPDPVAQDEGVFGVLSPEEMSCAEQQRSPRSAETPTPAEAAPPSPAPRLWTPHAILSRVTELYGRFKNPWRSAPPPHRSSQGDPRS